MKTKPRQKRAIADSLSSRNRWIAGLFAIGLVACIAIGASTSGAQQLYRVTDLGTVDGMTASEPAAINNLGQIAGTSSAGTIGCAFRYYRKSMEDMGGELSRGFAISGTGVVVGDFAQMEPSTPNHAALFTEGATIDLGVLPGALFSRANGVNSNGYVVGYSGSEFDSNNSRAFVWHRSTGMVDLGTLGGSYAQAMAVNDAGWVTGNSDVTLSNSIGARHAFLTQVWPGTGAVKPMRDLGTLGGPSSYGMAINMSNHVVGYSMLNNTNTVHAFLYNGGKLIDLGSLSPNVPGSDYSLAYGINNADQVVGYSYVAVGDFQKQAAFVYGADRLQIKMVNLNEVIGPAAKEYWLFAATAINDHGQIVACAYRGSDGFEHAVLLNPLAGPMTNE